MKSYFSLRFSIPALLFLSFTIASLGDHYYYLPHYENEAEQEGIDQARQLMIQLQSSINIMFRRSDTEGIRIQLSSLGASPDTLRAAIIDENGVIILSHRKEDVGNSIVKSASSLINNKILDDFLLLKNGITQLTEGEDSVLSVYPVTLNQLSNAVRELRTGFLIYEKNITLDKQIKIYYANHHLILHITVMSGFAFALWGFLYFLITRRVDNLLGLTSKISDGAISEHKSLEGNDEFSLIEKALVKMSKNLGDKQRHLTESENRLRKSQYFSQMGSWEWTIHTGELHWSDNVASNFGLTEKELPDKNDAFMQSVHPDDRDLVAKNMSECINNNTIYDVKHRFIKPDGTIIWIHVTGNVEHDKYGTAIRMLGMVKDITALKDSELVSHQILRELDYQKSAIDKHSIVGVTDSSGKIIYVNDNFIKISGYSRDELIGKTHRVIASDYHPPEFYKDMWETVSSGKTWQSEVCDKKKNGDLYWLNTTIIPHFNEQGELDRYSAIRTDITDEVNARQTIAEEQKRLKVINDIQSGCLVGNTPGVIFNQLLETLLTMTESEFGFIGEVETSVENKASIKAIAISNTPWNYESQALYDRSHESGIIFNNLDTLSGHVITTGQAVISNDPHNDHRSSGLPDGHPDLNAFLGVPLYAGSQLIGLACVANRRNGYDEIFLEKLKPLFTTCSQAIAVYRTEESRRRIAIDLSRFKSTLDHSMDCIFIFDPVTLNFLYVNEGATQQIGYTHDELINLTPVDISPNYDENEFRSLLASLISGPQHSITFETKHQHLDGHNIPVEIFLQYVDVVNEPPRFVISSRDISEKQQLQNKLEQAQKMEAIGQLTGGIAHDFNNILTSIIGFTNLSLQRLVRDDQTELREYLKEVAIAGERARDIVSQLLAFSRTTESNAVQMDVSPIITESIKLLTATLPTSIVLTSKIDSDIPLIKMAPVQLQQAIMNICINARDSIENKGNIEILARHTHIDSNVDELHNTQLSCDTCLDTISPGNYLEILISDTGSGMSENTKKRIFEPFYTTKDIGKGTGMGLSMVHGIIHSNSGHIRVITQPGIGTTFKLFFPAIDETVQDDVENNIEKSTHLTSYDLKGSRILIVDDEKSVAKFIGGLLTSVNADVTILNNSLAAWDLFKQDPTAFDLLITDQTMPHLTGVELSTRVISLRPQLPIIMTSGYSENINEATALKMGISGFLHKPIDNTVLINTVIQSLPN